MSTILEAWELDEPTWYHNITSLQFQFFAVHLIADILVELNKLNRKFQCDHVDITSRASTMDVTITLLRRQYLIEEFGRTSKYLGKFLQDVVPIEQVLYIDRYRVEKVHNLHYESMSGCNVEGTLEQCKILGASYVQKVIDSLNNHFPNLPIFTSAKLFSPKHYPLDDHDRSQLTKTWLA